MKNLFESVKIGAIFGKFLINQESEEELEQVEAWRKEDPSHEDLVESLLDEENLSRELEKFEGFNKEEAWNRYMANIAAKKNRSIYIWRIVAVLIFVGGLSSYVLLNYFSEKDTLEQVLPGAPIAYLELADGQKWDLQSMDEQNERRLNEKTGIVVKGNTVIDSKSDNNKIQKYTYEPIALVTPRGGEYKMILEDGTEVWMNADSKLIFPKKFAPEERHVKLSGEAYFKVAKDITRPFIVSLENMDIEVLGTEFNVAAYTNDNLFRTTLVEGKVLVKNSDVTGNDSENNFLSSGDQAVFNKSENTIEIKQVDVTQYTAWKDGKFIFNYQSFEDITKILSRWYDVEFKFTSESLKEIPFSGEFRRYENLSSIYEIIKKTGTKMEFKQEDKIIEISE